MADAEAAPGAGRPSRRLAAVFGVVGYGFAVGAVALAVGCLVYGPSLPPAKRPAAWVSVFGFHAALACGILGAIWLDGRAALLAGRSGAAWGYAGLGVAVLAVVVAAFRVVGGLP